MFRPLAIALVALAASALPGAAQNRLSDLSDIVAVDFLPGWQERDGARVAGLRIRLAEGWKTYWRSPGEAGIPPRFDWSGSTNVAALGVVWPHPKAFTLNGLTSIGYTGDVILPIEVTPRDAAAPVRLRLGLEIGVCEDVCIPAVGTFGIELSGPGAPSRPIRNALDTRALTPAQAGVQSVTCRLRPKGRDMAIEAKVEFDRAATAMPVAIEVPNPNLWVNTTRVAARGRSLTARTEILNYGAGPIAIDRSGIRVTVIGPKRAIEIQGCPSG